MKGWNVYYGESNCCDDEHEGNEMWRFEGERVWKRRRKKRKNEGVWIVEFMTDEQHTQDVEEDEDESIGVKQSRE